MRCLIAPSWHSCRLSYHSPLLPLLPTAQCPLRLPGSPSFGPVTSTRTASHAAQGVANGPRQGPGKRLGAKVGDSAPVVPGNILFRQRGSKWWPGENCVMGRDHTISALAKGYVRFYRDPARHPRRKYIGIVFEPNERLPRPPHWPRRRQLGMVPRAMEEVPQDEIEAGVEESAGEYVPAGLDAVLQRPKIVKGMARLDTEKGAPRDFRHDYRFQETNTSIGRTPERAGVRTMSYKPGNRWLAWKRRAKKKERAKAKAVITKGKGKQAKRTR